MKRQHFRSCVMSLSVLSFKVKISYLLSAASHPLADRGLVLTFGDLMGQTGRGGLRFCVFRAVHPGTWSVTS